jgi:pimeloyl-ACP methyl ester carboxylesterase
MRNHAEDLAGLLRAVGAVPAVLIGRSYGGGVSVQAALREPEAVHAMVLLEPAITGVADGYDAWESEFDAAIVAAAAAGGAAAAAQLFLRGVFGENYAELLPVEVQQVIRDNAPAIVAESRGPVTPVKPEDLATITVPVLVVCAASSPRVFRTMGRLIAEGLPAGRLVRVEGSHLIDPANPEVLAFLDEVLLRPDPG